ncbi:MAG: hypothetical protein ACUVRA_08885 [Candidatus Bathyarchaeaceae archaeon]
MGKGKMKFEKLLIKSVDDSLKDTFGEVAANIIYKHLEMNHSLKKEEIPNKLEVFIEGLEKYLNSGVIVVEGLVLKKLCSNLGRSSPREEQLNFVDYITKLRRTSDSVCM